MQDRIRHILISMLCISSVISCGKNKDSDAQPVEPQVLSIDGFQAKSFAELSWEDKCTGTKQFFSDFQRIYLQDASITFSDESCSYQWAHDNTYFYLVDFTLKNGESEFKMKVQLWAHFDPSKFNMQLSQLDFYKADSTIVESSYRYAQEDSKIGSNMIHLDKTLQAWLKAETTEPLKIFGYSYPDYLEIIESKLGSGSEGLQLTLPNVKFQLLKGNEVGSGTVKFVTADLSNYTKKDESGAIVQKELLDCLDLTCLNESPISYEIRGPMLVMSSPDIIEQVLNGIPVYAHQEFRVNLDFLKKN